MTVLTQRNVTIFCAAQVAWSVYTGSGVLGHSEWVTFLTVTFNALTTALAFMGFNRTPSGSVLTQGQVEHVDASAAARAAVKDTTIAS